MTPQTLHLLALSLVPKLGPVTARNLIAWCGDPVAVFETHRAKLMRVPGIGRKVIDLMLSRSFLEEAKAVHRTCQQHEITIISYLDKAYPVMLKELYDAPLILYKRGKADLNAQPGIALVGTRKATDQGKATAEQFAQAFVNVGINVVSGLAYGIDFAAHKATLKAGGITTAVLAHGLDTIYPAVHASKAKAILEKGAWISEYPPGSKIDPGNFPARNRIIAGLCKATIVVEAANKGGALITGRFAFDQNREVYAIPGRLDDPYAEGCNALIRDQIAKLVTSPEEVLQDLGLEQHEKLARGSQLEIELPAVNLAITDDESKVLTFLNRGEALMDIISMNTGIAASRLHAVLLGMEFRGLIRQMPGKKFRRL